MAYNVGRWRTSQDQVLYMGHCEQARPTAGDVDPGSVHRGVRGARKADRSRKAERELAAEIERKREVTRKRRSKDRRKAKEAATIEAVEEVPTIDAAALEAAMKGAWRS